MPFDHERLDVYRAALDFVVIANDIVEQLPRGRGHLSDQLTRASISIVLNIAEGAGKHSKPDKRRYYLTAAGSATVSAAILDICMRLALIEQSRTNKPRHSSTVSSPCSSSSPRRSNENREQERDREVRCE